MGNNPNLTSAVVLPGLKWTDVMTYCSNLWISRYTYQGILARLYAENGLDPNGGPGTIGPLQLQADATRNSSTKFIDIIASVDFTKSHAAFKYVQRSDSPYFQLAGDEGEAIIRTVDSNGTTIQTFHALLFRYTDVSPDADQIATVHVSIPYDDRISSLELMVNETIKTSYSAGGQRAAVSDLFVKNAADLNNQDFSMMTSATPAEGVNAGILVKWEAVGEGVTYTVEISADKGHMWNTVAVGLAEHYLVITPSKMGLSAGKNLMVRVTANDGIRSTAVDTKSITIAENKRMNLNN